MTGAKVHGVIEYQVPCLLNGECLRTFLTALTAPSSAGQRVLVLRGTLADFCLGMDLQAITADGFDELGVVEFGRVLEYLSTTSLITIAVVDGKALGGGVGIAAACDWIIASEYADFSLPELVLGLIPAMILPLIVERIGAQPAKRWLLSQAHWSAEYAEQIGLIDQRVQRQRLESELKRTLRQLMRCPPQAIAELKQALIACRHLSRLPAITEGQQRLTRLLSDNAIRAEIIAFREYGLLPVHTRNG